MIQLKQHQKRCSEQAKRIVEKHGIVMLVMQTRTGKTYTAADIVQGGKKIAWLTTKSAKPDQKQQALEYGVKPDMYHYGQMSGLPQKINRKHMSESERFETRIKYNKTIQKFLKTKYDYIVIDETHKLCQTPQSRTIEQRTLHRYSSYYDAKFVILSATPTPEGTPTLYHILQATGHSPWKHINFYKWVADGYVKTYTVNTGNYEKTQYDHGHPKILKEVKHLYVQAKQKEAGITTEIKERELHVNMSSYTDYVYNTLHRNRYVWFNGDFQQEVYGSTPAIHLSKKLQITGGSVILTNKSQKILDKAKAYAIIRDMNAMKYEKVAVFYRFRSERKILTSVFPESILTEDHEELQAGNKRIFIGQVKTCREGIRLDQADALYMYSPDDSYLSYQQSKNRLQHMKRDKNPEFIWVISHMGYEKTVIKKMKRKAKTTQVWYK